MIRVAEVLATDAGCAETVTLTWEDRYRRRVAMRGDGGTAFLLDLAHAVALVEGQGLRLEDGRVIGVRAAEEELMEARAPDAPGLVRAAWHVGNRHLPCAIRADRLVLRRDHVIAGMLRGLGCEVVETVGPFHPEGGAYGGGHAH